MSAQPTNDDHSWSSSGLARGEAISQWRDWAANTIAPIDVTVYDTDQFAAQWTSHGVGQLRLLQLHAPAQRVVHTGTDGSAGRAAPSIQLVYARRGALKTRMAGKRFTVEPGQFVLLDNTRFYQMEMDTAHEAIDLMMPQGWLEKYLPDPDALLARPISANSGWGAPLGSLIETMVTGLDESPLPRPLIAEQVGALLTLATGFHEAPPSRHRGQLARQILRRIETDYADPDLTPERIAGDLGISRRYLQALLAGSGTSFVQELNATRLDRASDLLTDPRAAGLTLGDVAWRCGFLDPGYFARLFRKRFGVTPSVWRMGGAGR
ncbi:helix-turn-helix domain-containing protein [Sphingobium nicotianae]|uniref:Helix-turn-helix domain-containing protein n=1 Tax=Sphingobium nicotianae TaxID=2782607 RepID=A0A9X1IPN4_9SPHN|nr:helix-turn-helix domain-containing protein [Sphingobium nicotianae]MBT2186164.1 helix-turn-helix domain-containing protein [Sphingobium nicotianae]